MNSSIQKVFRVSTVLFLSAVAAMGLSVAHAKNIKKQNLLELMTHPDSILVGTVTEKTDGFYRGLPFTEVTVDVGQSIKGEVSTRKECEVEGTRVHLKPVNVRVSCNFWVFFPGQS